jgi:hypothetical protein
VTAVLVDLGGWSVGEPVALVVAQDPRPPQQGEEFGKASPVALVVIVLLGLATVALVRSMTKRLKRLPASFDEPADRADGATPADRATDTGSSER